MKQICDDASLRQIVAEPTRGLYLLDLCLTDLDCCKVRVTPAIADHKGLLVSLGLPCPKSVTFTREVWHFNRAAWSNLKCDLRACDWERLLFGSVNDAVDYFMELLTLKCREHIPSGKVNFGKQTHAWLNEACAHAIHVKNNAEGSDGYVAARDACARVLNEAYHEHVARLKTKISGLEKSDN